MRERETGPRGQNEGNSLEMRETRQSVHARCTIEPRPWPGNSVGRFVEYKKWTFLCIVTAILEYACPIAD